MKRPKSERKGQGARVAPVRRNALEKGIAGKAKYRNGNGRLKSWKGTGINGTEEPTVREKREAGKGRNRG